MSALTVDYRFADLNGAGQRLSFPCKKINTLARNRYLDNYDFYQSAFNVFGWMRLNRYGEFEYYKMTGSPLLWQQHDSCNLEPLGNIKINKTSTAPCRAYLFASLCYDEIFHSCFEHFVTYENGEISFDENGDTLLQMVLDQLMTDAVQGGRMTLATGKLYDAVSTSSSGQSFEFSTDDTTVQEAFVKTHNTCEGWLTVWRRLATTYKWMLHNELFDSATTNDKTCGIEIDVLQLFDDLKCRAQPQLKTLINRGGTSNIAKKFRAIFLVDDITHGALVNQYNAQCQLPAQNCERITKVEIQGQVGAFVYYIDNVPIVPVCEIQDTDVYLNNSTLFAGFTASGNIQLGWSFEEIRNIDEPDIGMSIERSTFGKDSGKYYFRSHSLFHADILEPKYTVGAMRRLVNSKAA